MRITDKAFVYTPSYDTDLAKKFRLIIERQRNTALKRAGKIPSVDSLVVPIAPGSRILSAGF